MAKILLFSRVTKNDDSHLVIPTLDGNVQVVPCEVIQKLIFQEMRFEELEDWEMIVRSILAEWLKAISEKS